MVGRRGQDSERKSMRKKIVQALLTGVMAACLAASFAACSSGGEESKFDVLVTFNYNVSHLLDAVSCKTQYLGLKKGGIAVAPGDPRLGIKFESGEVEQKYIDGWYLAVTDEDGHPLDVDGDFFRNDKDGNAIKTDAEGYLLAPDGETYLKTAEDKRLFLSPLGLLSQEEDDEPFSMTSRGFVNSLDGKTAILDGEGNPLRVTRVEVALDTSAKWNFAGNRVEEDVTLYAHYIDMPYIRVLDAVTGTELKQYFGTVGEMAFDPGASEYPRKDGYTLYGLYENAVQTYEEAADSETFAFNSYRYPSAEDIGENGFPVKTVYAFFLEGVWNIARTPSQFASALSTANARIWLDCDIEYTSEFSGANKVFNGEVNGNNHTVKGISVDRTATRYDPTETGFGIFGRLGAAAYIHDIIFEDATYKFSAAFSSNYHLGLLAGVAEEGARIERVRISGTLELAAIADKGRLSYGKLIGTDRGAVITDTTDGNITLIEPPEPEQEQQDQ